MCLLPIKLKSGDTVSCNKCIECKARRANAWSFRLMQELKIATSAHFLTITYDSAYLPFTRDGLPTLSKRDLQLFFKRLRKAHGKDTRNIKYYACGEYGSKTQRPHYHIILLNAELKLIDKAWNQGAIQYGKVEIASTLYCMKYMCKPSLPKYDTRQKEFALMSKGIGKSYLTQSQMRYHLADLLNRNYLTLPGGRKIAMPRYYTDKIYSIGEKAKISRHLQAKLLDEQIKVLLKYCDKPEFEQNKKAAVAASFNRMHKKAVCKKF